MTPAETLQGWRAEIASELEQLEQEAATARREQATAEASYRAAVGSWEQLQAMANRGVGWREDGMAGALYSRLEASRREALRSASGPRGAARARVKMLDDVIAGRRLALRQIDAALSPTKPSNVREIVPRAKKAAPVDFEVIVPKEAV